MFIYISARENWLWDLDYITSKHHTKIYAQGLVDYVQKFMYYASLAAPDPSLTL